MAKKLALGKGIASLIQETPNQILAKSLAEKEEQKNNKKEEQSEGPLMVSVTQIKTNPNQPRKIFKEKELEELSQSIKENGVIQPLIVSKINDGFELIAGERRFRASKMAGLEYVPVVVKAGTDREKMIMSIIENVQRSDLNCVEEALAYYQLMDDYKLTQEEVAKRLGKERSSVANFLRVLKLPRKVIDLLQKEELSFGHAKILAAVKEREACIEIAEVAAAENMSVRELETLAKKHKTPKKEKMSTKNKMNMDSFKQELERKTGFHFGLKSSEKGKGQIVIKFGSKDEFNDIYDYLINRK